MDIGPNVTLDLDHSFIGVGHWVPYILSKDGLDSFYLASFLKILLISPWKFSFE